MSLVTCRRRCLVLVTPSREPVDHFLPGDVQAGLPIVPPSLFAPAQEGIPLLLRLDLLANRFTHQPMPTAPPCLRESSDPLAHLRVDLHRHGYGGHR